MSRVCVDIGGAFTDCVVLDEKGKPSEFKAPSTPADFLQGVLRAMGEATFDFSESDDQVKGHVNSITP
jgi:N-methylhydantoinase A